MRQRSWPAGRGLLPHRLENAPAVGLLGPVRQDRPEVGILPRTDVSPVHLGGQLPAIDLLLRIGEHLAGGRVETN